MRSFLIHGPLQCASILRKVSGAIHRLIKLRECFYLQLPALSPAFLLISGVEFCLRGHHSHYGQIQHVCLDGCQIHGHGRSGTQIAQRVDSAAASYILQGAIDALCDAHVEDLVIVAHFGAILSVVQRAAGIAPRADFAFTLAPLSLSRVDFLGEDQWRIERVNHRP